MSRSTLLLTTIGAHSNRPRTNPLAYFPDGSDSWLIIASSGGAARHPGWFHNLARNPDRVWIQVGRRRLQVRPEVLSGVERDDHWRRVVILGPHFGRYQTQTDRQIPVIRLTRAEQ
jgi:deazaflavin-dependent oxidoreductase (nitroreductase family)